MVSSLLGPICNRQTFLATRFLTGMFLMFVWCTRMPMQFSSNLQFAMCSGPDTATKVLIKTVRQRQRPASYYLAALITLTTHSVNLLLILWTKSLLQASHGQRGILVTPTPPIPISPVRFQATELRVVVCSLLPDCSRFSSSRFSPFTICIL